MESVNIKKIAIVGRGFAGLTSAIVLKRAGYEVELIGPAVDENSASQAAHGASTIKGLLESTQPLFALKMFGHQTLKTWLREIETISGIKIPKIIGVSERFDSLPEFKKEQGRIYKSRFLGAFCVLHNPGLENVYPQDFWIDSDQYLQALNVACQKLLIPVATEAFLTDLKESNDKVILNLGDHDSYACDAVILALGAGVQKIQNFEEVQKNFFGAPGYTARAKKLKSATEEKSWCVVKELAAVAVWNDEVHIGSTTEANGIPLLGKPFSEFKRVQNEESVLELFHRLYSRVVGREWKVRGDSSVQLRWGVRVRTKDRLPMVGPISAGSRIFINTGYYKSGISLTHVGADLLLSLLTQENIAPLLQPMTTQSRSVGE